MPLPTLFIKGSLYSEDPDELKILQEYVPIEYIVEWFKQRISKTGIENRVCIVLSGTGSGKSTAISPYLYKTFVMGKSHSPGIIQTQPRVITAIGVVKEMLPNYPFLRLEKNIGWSTQYNKLRPKETDGILSATIGTLAQMLKTNTDEEMMKKYKFILIDETHERDLQTDMTLYMLKNFLNRVKDNPNAPFVVLMSATFDPQSFLDYFGVPKKTNFIWCRGESHGFDEMWDWNEGRTVSDYCRAAADVVEKIVNENQDDDPTKADILIFLPGSAEMQTTQMWLSKVNLKLAEQGKKVFSILKIDSEAVNNNNIDYRRLDIPVDEYEITIDAKKYTPSRRLIMSTNVAETGLTLGNLKYVIDAGFNREKEFNPVYEVDGLITRPAPKSRIRQRRGRAGRKFRGVFYPLYPKYIFDRLPELQLPQILIQDISTVVLDMIHEQLKSKNLQRADKEFRVEDIDMVDPPTPDAILTNLEKLYAIGFISPLAPEWCEELTDIKKFIQGENNQPDVDKFGLTKLGHLARMFSMIIPESVRMILAGYSWGCSILDLITIAAYINLDQKQFTARPEDERKGPAPGINWTAVYKAGFSGYFVTSNVFYKTRLLIADEFIDGLVLFNAIKNIISGPDYKKSISDLKDWCGENHISFKTIRMFINSRDELINQMLELHLDVFAGSENSLLRTPQDELMNTITNLKYCIYEGFRCNILTFDGEKYVTSSGLEVATPKILNKDEEKMAEAAEYGFMIDVKPSYIIYKKLGLKLNRKTNIYSVISSFNSVLDGYVSPDYVDYLI